MATWIIFTAICMIFLTMLYYRRVRQYYVDKSVYELRQCKHDIIMYRGYNAKSLTDADFKDIDSILNSIQELHDNFLKIGGLKFKTVRIIINNTILSLNVETKGPKIVNEKPELMAHCMNAINYSLKAIPFLRLRIIIHLIRLVLNGLIVLGLRNANRNLEKFERFVNAGNDKHYNNHCMNV